jgi:hypothetical protein
MDLTSETNTPAASSQRSSSPSGNACPEYWRLYLAWVQTEPGRQDTIRARMTAHIAVCGCRMGLGGKWSPMDEPIHEDEKSGGW